MNLIPKFCLPTSNRYMLLLGAGASVPFIKITTHYLTTRICLSESWVNILDEYKEVFTTKDLSVEFVSDLINKIISINTKWNFEDICHIIDIITQIQENDYDNYGKLDYAKVINVLKNCDIIGWIRKFNTDIIHLPFIYRCLITSLINDTSLFNINTDTGLLNKQTNFIKFIANKNPYCSIVSLNYDDTINQSIRSLNFFNGFVQKYDNNQLYFEANSFHNAKRSISYLHGHVRFYNDSEKISFIPQEIPSTFQRFESLRYGRMAASRMDENMKNYSYNTFITTGLSKEISLNYSPYNHYYTKFVSDLCKSDTIIIIGYSFNDEHINRCLSSFLKITKKKRIIIIDYKKELSQSPFLKDDIITSIHIALDCDLEMFNINEIININDGNKFGWIYPQVLFYNNGYESFLNDYKEVLSLFSDTIYTT